MLDDAPTGGAEALFGGMGMDMDYDDDYSDEGDYDAEVCGSPMLFVAELTGRYSMMTWRKNWDGLRKRSSICLWHLVSLLHIVWNELTCRWL
jgi:hypothetical protein